MKVFQKIALTTLVISGLFLASCGKQSTPSPNPNPDPQPNPATKIEITASDLKNKYFIYKSKKNTFQDLFILYYKTANNKFVIDGLGYRREQSPQLKNVNTTEGTAELVLDTEGDGSIVYKFYLKKLSDGNISLEKTELVGSSFTQISSTMYDYRDISGFTINNAVFAIISNGKEMEFSPTQVELFKYSPTYGYESEWTKEYYTFLNYVGYKTNDEKVMGAIYKNADGKIAMVFQEGMKVYESVRK